MTMNEITGSPEWVDPDDAPVLTEADVRNVEIFNGDTFVRRGRGRPKTGTAKELVSLRLDPDVLARLRSAGPGWQTQVNLLLRQVLGLEAASETMVAVYDTHANAELAAADLIQAGVPESAITMHANSASMVKPATAAPREEGFWASLFGGSPDHGTTVYERSMEGGSTIVTVRAQESQITGVMDILESHKPIDIDERAASYGMTGTAAPAATTMATAAASGAATALRTDTAATGGTMQLSEESLAVGKRVVNRGGTRIRRFVVETPTEQNFSLYSEKVTLERRPVTDGRPVTDSFTKKTIEMTESAEEAVVSKTARVYEEVGLRKEATDRVETIRDTVRKEEVEVEQIPGMTARPRQETRNSRSDKLR